MYSIKKIQREQSQLSRIDREITSVLEMVNETLNALKVEELQLRASSVTELNVQPTAVQMHNTGTAREIATNTSSFSHFTQVETDVDAINQQEINLDLFVSSCNRDEEMDEIEDF